MAAALPTRTAIYLLAGIAAVYLTLTVVLFVTWIRCCLYHRKQKRVAEPELAARNAIEVEERGEEDTSSYTEDFDLSAGFQGHAVVATTDHSGKTIFTSELRPSPTLPHHLPLGITAQTGSISTSLDGSRATADGSRATANGKHISSRNQVQPLAGDTPRTSQNVTLPPLPQRPPAPELQPRQSTPSSSSQDTTGTNDTQHEHVQLERSESNTSSTLPRVKEATGQEYTVLTVHKSTLKRKRKSTKIEPSEESISEKATESSESVSKHTDSTDNTHTNQSNQTNRSNQSRLFKPPPKDRPRVTRTESTKPLIMDLEEEEEEEDESPTAEQIPEEVRWDGQVEDTMQEGGLVLENLHTQESEGSHASSLNVLQSDIMDMITSL